MLRRTITKPIEDIHLGDKVLAYNEETGEKAYKPVLQLFRNKTNKWYHIYMNNEEITCTGGHPFYVVGKGFIEAKSLTTSDELLLSTDKVVTIKSIEVEELVESETTYNFEVEGFHTYYVSETKVLVHNKCPGGEFYRGGNDFTASAKELRYTDGGLVKNTHGISVNTDAAAVRKFGTPYKIIDIPDELNIIQRGINLYHYEIVPVYEMTFVEYQGFLAEIVAIPIV